MSQNLIKPIKVHWDNVQNDAAFDPSNLIEIVRFLARCAAERDVKKQATNTDQERQGTDD